VSNVSVNLDRT